MNDTIVIFGDRGARIMKGVNAFDWQGVPNVAINPDLSAVKGIPPHHWQLVDSKIVPKPEAERTEPNPPTVIEHKIMLDPDFLKPHLEQHLIRHKAECLLAGFASAVGGSFLAALILKLLRLHG